MARHASAVSAARAARRNQRGLGLLEVMLIVVLAAGALVAGVIGLQTRRAAPATEDALRTVAQADRALAAYAATFGRLPCPDTTNDGVEDCAGGQKGRLPFRTLALQGGAPDAALATLGYLVQRQAVDLAQIASVNNRYEPMQYDASQTSPNYYNGRRALTNFGTSADFCQGLSTAQGVALGAGHAQAGGSAVAYAVFQGGLRDADSDGNLFDGTNAAAGATLESPARAGNASAYDDTVLVRSYATLADTLDCGRFAWSLEALSAAADVVDEVNSQKAATTLSAGIMTAISGVKAIVGGVKIAGSAITISTASGYLTTASTLLATAIATCVFIVGCAEIPHATASVVAATVAIVASGIAIGLNAGAMAANGVAFGKSLAAAIEAGAEQNADIDLSAAVASSLTAWNSRTTATATALAELNTAKQRLTAANTARDTAWTAMFTEGRQIITDVNNKGDPTKGTMATTALDSYLTALKNPADAWAVAAQAQEDAASRLKEATDTVRDAANNPSPVNVTNLRADLAAAQAAGNTQRVAELQAALDYMAPNVGDLQRRLAEAQAAGDTQRAEELQRALTRAQAIPADQSLAGQIAGLSTRITELQNRILALNTQIAAEADATARAALVVERDRAETQRAGLQGQLNNLSFDVGAAQTQYNAAVTNAASKLSAFNTARDNAVNAFNDPNLQYTVCVTKDKKTTCTTSGWDQRDRIKEKIRAVFDNQWKDNKGLYFKAYSAQQIVTMRQTGYDAAVTSEARAKLSYESLRDTVTTGASGGDGSDRNPTWNDAQSILKGVDARGGVR